MASSLQTPRRHYKQMGTSSSTLLDMFYSVGEVLLLLRMGSMRGRDPAQVP